MSHRRTAILLAALSLISSGAAASAESLRCQSVNGNLNCTGSSGAACQTIDGKTVCSSGHGDVVQSFGGAKTFDLPQDAIAALDDLDGDDLPPARRPGPMPHPRTDGTAVDRY